MYLSDWCGSYFRSTKVFQTQYLKSRRLYIKLDWQHWLVSHLAPHKHACHTPDNSSRIDVRSLELVLAKPFFFHGEAPKLSRVVTIDSVPAVVTTRGLPATNLRKGVVYYFVDNWIFGPWKLPFGWYQSTLALVCQLTEFWSTLPHRQTWPLHRCLPGLSGLWSLHTKS